MKEIGQFIEMMEGDALLRALGHERWALQTIQATCAYESLKALADKPVSKVEITDKMIKVASKKLHEQLERVIYHNAEALAENVLEVVFDHIANGDKMVGPDISYKDAQKAENKKYTEICDIVAYRTIHEKTKKYPFNCGCSSPCYFMNDSGLHCLNCHKREPKKQTLLEFMDEKVGYKGEVLPKASRQCREVYKNVSE